MKLSTVAEALASQEEEPILAIRGTLSKLFDPFTGEGEHGAWSIQNGAIKDKTGEIKVMFSNRDAVPKVWRGKEIELRCQKGAKGGWSGVKVETDKKDKKPVLKVSTAAEVFLYDGEHQSEPANAPAKAASSPPEPPQAAPKVNTAAPVPRPPDEAANLAEGKGRIYEVLNTQLAVISLVHEYLVPAVKQRTGQTIDAQQEAALVQNCLIQLYYEKSHHFFAKRPYKVGETPPTNGT
jgi:hypothetical protein